MRRVWRRVQAWLRLDLQIVCEESAGKDEWTDFHDFYDNDPPVPVHFQTMMCRRCGKVFYI